MAIVGHRKGAARKAGGGYDRQLGLPVTSVAGEVALSPTSIMDATSLGTLSVAYNRHRPEKAIVLILARAIYAD